MKRAFGMGEGFLPWGVGLVAYGHITNGLIIVLLFRRDSLSGKNCILKRPKLKVHVHVEVINSRKFKPSSASLQVVDHIT